MKKLPASSALEGTLASKSILEHFRGHHTVESRFAGQKSGLAPVLIVRGIAEQIEPSPSADKTCDPHVGNRFVMLDRRGSLREGRTVLMVGHEHASSESPQRNKPCRIGEAGT